MTACKGQSRGLSPHRPYRSSPPHGRRITFHQPPQGLGRCPKLHLGMAYLLVWVDDTSEAGTYGMAIVWINSCQAGMFLMGEALEMLSSLTPRGSNWPYVLIQLYEGANHMPLLKDRHVCILPQGEAEIPSGQISQLKICWLLSTGPLVVFPTELNGGDQSMTINLPESLHTGSSVTSYSILTLRSTFLHLFLRSRAVQVCP